MPSVHHSISRPRFPNRLVALVAGLALGAVSVLGAPAVHAAPEPPQDNCCFYTVSGTVWYDQNGNGIKEGTEPPLAGWTVKAYDVTNVLVGTTTTNALGQYTFPVPVGCGATFQLKQVVQSGWTQTFPPASGFHTGSGTGCAGTDYGPYNFGNTTPNCAPFTKTYTLDADFNLGTLNGVVTNVNQLELSSTPTTWPYAWVANAGEGTLSKIDTATGKELARYYTGPPDGGNGYGYLSPSRTVVDKDGNCWVANRSFWLGPASVTQILGSGGVDFNANSVINTSNDANANGVIDPWEILPWGQDERVVRHYNLGSPTGDQARGMTIDKMGFLWVGLCTTNQLVKVSTTLPIATYGSNMPSSYPPVLATIPIPGLMPYGLAVSPNGLIYMSTLSDRAYQVDPGLASGGTGAGPAITEYINHGGCNYGLTVDKNCVVWLAMIWSPGPGGYGCVRWDPPLTAGNPLNGWTYSNAGAPAQGRGIGIDFNNDVWMACNDGANSAVKFSNTPVPNVLGVYPTPSPVPVGIGPASDGNIIVTPSGASNWSKLNVSTGAVISLPGPQLVGFGPYTYSDFTGSGQAMNNVVQGNWTVVTDGGSSSLAWNFIGWNGATPASTSLLIEARTANTVPALASQTWITIGSPGPLGTPLPGRYIETRARLQRNVEGCNPPVVTPILYDLTVSAICDPCGFANCPSDTTIACMSPTGAEFFYNPPILKAICGQGWTVSCSPAGNFFPVGTTPVICTAVNAVGDTVRCQFNVTVTGGCDLPPTGACCVNGACSITTAAACEQQGGIYFGDNTNCNGGCNQNCAVPPNNLVAWWPLNSATGGVTPNLARPATGGTLVNGPTPVIGQKVVNAYHFNGQGQYINVPNHPSLNVGGSDLTVDAWVRTNVATGVTTIVDKRDSAPIQGFAFFIFNGYPAFQLAVGNNFSNYILSAANGGTAAFVADGNWHLLAVTVDRDNPTGGHFYVDGSAVGTPFNPTARQGNLGSNAALLIAQRQPALGGGFFNGDLDEVEIACRALTAEDILRLWDAGASGKCPESCYATQNVTCCAGFNAASSVTICNYSLSPHVYSWGVTPLNGGAGCGPVGPTTFVPASGTLTVAAQSCVTVPISIGCPSNVPVGQVACYQVSLFNHDTGRLFGCRGSVQRTAKWCWHPIPIDGGTLGIAPISEGGTVTVQFEVGNNGPAGTPPEFISYMVQPLSGDTGQPSEALSLNGLPPGTPYIGELRVAAGGTGIVPIGINYGCGSLIGYDRIQVLADVSGQGIMEPQAEVAVRMVTSETSGVPEDTTPKPDGKDGDRLLMSFPNPFGSSDQIRFRVDGDRPAEVKLRLFDLLGRPVKTFYYEQTLAPGDHFVNWNTVDDRGQRLGVGIYFLKLDVGKRTESIKLMVRP